MNERRDYTVAPNTEVQEVPANYQAAPSAEEQVMGNANALPQQNDQKLYMAVPTASNGQYGYPQEIQEGNTATEEQIDKYEIEDEHIRYLNETKKREKNKNKQSSGKKFNDARDEFIDKANIKKAEDVGESVVEARMNYDAGAGACDLAIELLKFTDHSTVQKKEYKEYRRRSTKIKKSIKKAKKQERKATRRYYEVLAKEATSLTILKKAKKQEELALVLTKLEALIREREDVDAKLVELYKGADSAVGGKIRARANKKKYKKAKKVQRSLKSSNRRLEKLDVSEGLKTKIRFLFNTKIVSEATVTYSKYLLKKLKPQGIGNSLAKLAPQLRVFCNKGERL